MAEFRVLLNIARAGVEPEGDDEAAWERAVGAARGVPADLQAVFLVLAGAAFRQASCPNDAEIARKCGFHSAGRVRSQIRHLEKAGYVTVRNDLRGYRVVGIGQMKTLPGGQPSSASGEKTRRPVGDWASSERLP